MFFCLSLYLSCFYCCTTVGWFLFSPSNGSHYCDWWFGWVRMLICLLLSVCLSLPPHPPPPLLCIVYVFVSACTQDRLTKIYLSFTCNFSSIFSWKIAGYKRTVNLFHYPCKIVCLFCLFPSSCLYVFTHVFVCMHVHNDDHQYYQYVTLTGSLCSCRCWYNYDHQYYQYVTLTGSLCSCLCWYNYDHQYYQYVTLTGRLCSCLCWYNYDHQYYQYVTLTGSLCSCLCLC